MITVVIKLIIHIAVGISENSVKRYFKVYKGDDIEVLHDGISPVFVSWLNFYAR